MEESNQNLKPEAELERSGPISFDSEKSTMRKIVTPLAVILILIVGALLGIKAYVNKDAHVTSSRVLLSEGAEIPNLEMTLLDGKTVKLGDLNHKVMLINFWATWCEACMSEMPSIVDLREKYASKGFEVLGINVDENPKEAVPPTAKKFGINFPTFTDTDNKLAEMFDVHAIPLSVILNSDRKILYIESGDRDWNDEEMNKLVEQWLAN